jgi:predicted RNase H-like HicB family nuclease
MTFWLAKEQVNPMEPYYTIVFRKSAGQWVALCLENGLVGQGATKEKAAARLHEATASFEEGVQDQQDVYRSPISVKELHEFLLFDEAQPVASYELRAVYA